MAEFIKIMPHEPKNKVTPLIKSGVTRDIVGGGEADDSVMPSLKNGL